MLDLIHALHTPQEWADAQHWRAIRTESHRYLAASLFGGALGIASVHSTFIDPVMRVSV